MATHGRAAACCCAAIAAVLLFCASGASAQAPAGNAFLGTLQSGVAGAGAAGGNGTAVGSAVCEGKTPANVIIESVIPVPAAGQQPLIVIRNTGGQLANITGWRLLSGEGNTTEGGAQGPILYIADNARCRPNGTLASGQALNLRPRSDQNPCGFEFNLSATGTVTLADFNDAPKSIMSWDSVTEGTQVHVPPTGNTALRVPASGNILEVLRALGNYGTLILALQRTGLDQALVAASDPNYAGPQLPAQQFVLDLPWWFFGAQPTAAAAAPAPINEQPPASRPEGVPAAGPYTLLAPTDDAFDQLLTNLGGANGPLPLDALLAQPTLRDILLYHIIPGRYTSDYLRNNTAIYTAKGVEVVPIVDGCQTEGKIAFHDSCVDKPTGDNFTCAEQRTFGKCDFPFMISPLAAQWQGGFCQRTCRRCDCSPGSGVQCSISTTNDILASNGVIQGINRVLFPPPIFTKEQAIADAIAYNASLARNMSLGITPAAGLGGLNDVPGMNNAAGGVQAPGMLPATTAGNASSPLPGVLPVASPEVSPNVTASDASPSPIDTAAVASPSPSDSNTTAESSPSPAEGSNSGVVESPAPMGDGSNSTSEEVAASPAPTGEGSNTGVEVAASPAPGGTRRLRGHLW